MAEAFTAGVKMGGLTNDTEIRILLCYLIKSVGPVTREAMEAALLQEELVNYFEFVGALNDLVAQGLAIEGANGYTITEKGTQWLRLSRKICPAACGKVRFWQLSASRAGCTRRPRTMPTLKKTVTVTA